MLLAPIFTPPLSYPPTCTVLHCAYPAGSVIPYPPPRPIAAWIVKELPLEYASWLVVIVVIYTAISMLLAAKHHEKDLTRSSNF